mgnify:CR=1 FL=1
MTVSAAVATSRYGRGREATPEVLGCGDRLEVVRIAAVPHSAEVVELQAIRDRAVSLNPRNTMGVVCLPASFEESIAKGADGSFP